jgi:VanZ family protein
MGATGRHRWLRIAVGLLALGASIELAQGWLTETRTAEWLDMAANALGAAAGIAAAGLLPGNWCRQVEAVAVVGRRDR